MPSADRCGNVSLELSGISRYGKCAGIKLGMTLTTRSEEQVRVELLAWRRVGADLFTSADSMAGLESSGWKPLMEKFSELDLFKISRFSI